jgi:hypothetical protein
MKEKLINELHNFMKILEKDDSNFMSLNGIAVILCELGYHEDSLILLKIL